MRQERTPSYHRLVRLARPFPDFDFFFIRALRQKAVRLLALRPGDRVLDLGCGLGGSFPNLVQAVGSSGEVVGVEISPEVVENARRRREAWLAQRADPRGGRAHGGPAGPFRWSPDVRRARYLCIPRGA